MRVLLSTYGSRRDVERVDVEQVAGPAVRLRPLGAEVRVRALAATFVILAGVWL
jgi:hypothetical protein